MSSDTKKKVLLIDDEKFLLDIYSIKFHKRGFDVFACLSADEGLAALQGGYEPDAILFDITMPYKNGYEFLEELRARRLGKRSLKIALTNENQSGEMERTKELGADAHLIKAKYTPGEVVDTISTFLDHR
jgi:CheY-like chemotaxis protein